MSGHGWIGMSSLVVHTLSVVGADHDEEGRPIVRGCVVSFMGAGDELVLGSEAEYRIGGEWRGLAGLMHGTSYGLGVMVI